MENNVITHYELIKKIGDIYTIKFVSNKLIDEDFPCKIDVKINISGKVHSADMLHFASTGTLGDKIESVITLKIVN